MNLELKHLTAYLPYGINIIVWKKDKRRLDFDNIFLFDANPPHNIVPILRPMDDLVKELEINGEKFVPAVELMEMEFRTKLITCSFEKQKEDSFQKELKFKSWSFDATYSFENEIGDFGGTFQTYRQTLEQFEKMKEWHFDVFGLIDAGLAIDINTLQS